MSASSRSVKEIIRRKLTAQALVGKICKPWLVSNLDEYSQPSKEEHGHKSRFASRR